MKKTLQGFVVIKGDRIEHGTLASTRAVAQAKMVLKSSMPWTELENGGYSIEECEACFEVKEKELTNQSD